MPKSIIEAREEQARLGRKTPQINAQEDTLKSLEQKDFANQITLVAILAQFDITLSALQDALRGAGTKDFTTLEADLDKKPDETTANTEYNVTMTNVNTEYSQALPSNTRTLEFWAREPVAIRFSFTTGKVATPTAPYETLKSRAYYYKENLNLTDKTLYLACASGGNHVEIIAWT